MTHRTTAAALAATLTLALPPAPARAQAQTGTGGGPASTITAPNTTAVGQTKPPGGGTGVDARAGSRTGQQREDDEISRGICIGCGPE